MSVDDGCLVCGSPSVSGFLRRERVPVHMNMVMKDYASAVGINRGDLHLVVCESCGYIYNSAFDPSRLNYCEDYDNSQDCSPVFRDYLDSLADYLVSERGVKECGILEVGCGKGQFLRKLVSMEGADNTGIGFDPAYDGPECDLEGRLRFVKEFFDGARPGIRADVVICRHVLEHVPDPVGLLRSIRERNGSGEARVFFEVPCVEWILRNGVIWDFFYEHCSYFHEASLARAFREAGYGVERVTHVFGGQYLWLEARTGGGAPSQAGDPGPLVELARRFAAEEEEKKIEWRNRVESLAGKGKVAIWGAGAKGVTFANLIDPGRELVECVIDINPAKQHHYLPGTGHPIVAVADLDRLGIRFAVQMNPNYLEENMALLKDSNVRMEIL